MYAEKQHVVIGMGGLGREVASYLLDSGITQIKFSSEDLFYSPFEWLTLKSSPLSECGAGIVVLAIGDGNARARIMDMLPIGLTPGTFNFGSPRIKNRLLGEGSIICPGAQITVDVVIGKGVFVNLNCTIGHDTRLENFVTLNPGVHVSGNCLLGESATIGTGAVIREGVKVAKGATVGMGAVVVKDIDEPGVYVGNPARRIK